MTSDFDQLLYILANEETELPLLRLSELSDLEGDEVVNFHNVWSSIPVERRRQIISELRTLADENITLSFDVINRHAIQDDDSFVRKTAIQNLWESEDPKLVPHFLAALKTDPDADVRGSAASALGAFVLLGEMESLPTALHAEIEDALLYAFRNEEHLSIRRFCLESLGFSSRDEVDPIILESYETQDSELLQSSLLAMGRSADKQWQTHVLSHLFNPIPSIRREAVQATGELELRAAIPDLIEILDDVDRSVRHAAIWSLSQLGGSRAMDALTSIIDFQDDEEEIQLLEDALDNLAFVNETRDFLIFDFDEPEDTNS
ncbi:MAG: hypothetical protein GTO18_01460 [Anaerolineales bacterium]|nr:hypothetical protein [Anaerolineales bacterium]